MIKLVLPSIVLLYIDPGMGFIALQMLAATLLGGAFVFRRTLLNITTYIKLHLRRKAK